MIAFKEQTPNYEPIRYRLRAKRVLLPQFSIAESTYRLPNYRKKTKHFGHCDDEKSLSVLDDAKKQKMRCDVKLLYDVIGTPSDIHKNE